MFLLHSRFWFWVTATLLGGSAVTFAFVSRWHKQSQDEARPATERSRLGVKSESTGYLGALLGGIGVFAGMIWFVLWLVRKVF